MALQTKTFSTGSFAHGGSSNPGVSKGYVLDLILAEESVDVVANTSLVSYKLQLRSGSNNRFAGYLGASVSIGGNEVERATSIGLDAYYNHTYILLSDSITVKHDNDGSLKLAVKANIWQASENSYAPPSMEVSGSLELTQIPRVSIPTASPSPVAAGGMLTIRTNRKSDAFTHMLRYTFGNASGLIAEGVEDTYQWPVPEELAAQIPADTTGWGKIQCTTYHKGAALGTDETDLVVTVPQNETTRPKLEPVLQPVNNGLPEQFSGLYIQGKSKLQVSLNAQAWYSTIASQSLQVQGASFSGADPICSELLLLSGTYDVTCGAVDEREYAGSSTAQITVLAYKKPAVVACGGLEDVICCRCDAEGNPTRKGTRLLLKARRSWHSLTGLNSCTLRYRIREGGGAWSDDWKILLAADAAADEVSMVLPDELLSTKLTYQVQLSAVDTLGEEGVLPVSIGTANTPLHLGRGGRNVGIGRYCNYEHQDAVDIGWDIFLDQSINGMYLDTCPVNGTELMLQTRFTAFDGTESGFQTLLLWGSCGNQLILGTIGVGGNGTAVWSGTAGVSVAAGTDGNIKITIPQAEADRLVLMSSDKFAIN